MSVDSTKTGGLDVEGKLDYSDRSVPPEGRMSRLGLTMAFWAICSAMFWLIISPTLAQMYGTANTVIGMLLSVIAYSAINAIIARYSLRSGLSVSLFSRLLFGRYGAAIATFIYAISSIYYAVFEGSVIAAAGTFYFNGLTFAIAALIVCIYSVPLILGSVQHWLDKFNGYLLPFYIVGIAITVIYAISQYGYSNDWLTMVPESGAPPYGWVNVFIAYMGVWWMMMCTFDFARFGKAKDEAYHTNFNFSFPFYILTIFINGMVGIFLVQTIPLNEAVSEVSVVKGLVMMMGLFALLLIWVSQTRINTTNFYLSTVNTQAFFRLVFNIELPKYVWAIIAGCAIYLFMLADIFQYLLVMLAYQGVFIVAWVGVTLAYILCGHHSGKGEEGERADEDFPTYYLPGMIAWFGAVGIGIVALLVPSLALYSSPATAISSFVLFWLLATVPNRNRVSAGA